MIKRLRINCHASLDKKRMEIMVELINHEKEFEFRMQSHRNFVFHYRKS